MNLWRGFRLVLFTCMILAAAAVSIACEASAPEIIDMQWQINVVERLDMDLYEENLSFFIYASDEDGEDDISSIFLLHDESEQYWSLSSENWTVNTSGGEYWVGSSDIVMPDGSPIPRGDYRIVLYDAAGEKAEETIRIDTVVIKPDELEFPSISAKLNTITVSTPFENPMVLLFDRNRRFVDSAMIEFDNTPLQRFPRYRDLTSQSRNQLYLYVWDTEKGYGLISGPVIGLYDEARKSE